MYRFGNEKVLIQIEFEDEITGESLGYECYSVHEIRLGTGLCDFSMSVPNGSDFAGKLDCDVKCS